MYKAVGSRGSRVSRVLWMLEELETPLWNKLRHRFILPDMLPVDVGPAAAHDFANEIGTLDRRLAGRDYALGERFRAVDVILGDIGAWARGGRFEIRSDRVNAYFDRVFSRPARARSQANGGAH